MHALHNAAHLEIIINVEMSNGPISFVFLGFSLFLCTPPPNEVNFFRNNEKCLELHGVPVAYWVNGCMITT
jgi:hypothetical protein